jgi:hypothetical protein
MNFGTIELDRILDAPKRSKSEIHRYIASVTGFTVANMQNVSRALMIEDGIERGAARIMDTLAIFIGALGNSAAKAPAAAHLFLNEMRLVNDPGAADRQPHLKGDDGTPFGMFLASILLQGPEEIRAANWTVTIMGNPASAEIACGVGQSRRVFLFMGRARTESKPMVRAAKIVPAEVLAGLSDLILHGEANRERLGA